MKNKYCTPLNQFFGNKSPAFTLHKQHKKHMELPKNETTKILPFSLLLNFETPQKILGFPSKYETVKISTNSFDFYTNKTAKNETPKDISNFIVFETARKTALLKQ